MHTDLSLPGVCDVELLRGPDADPEAPPDLLVEVPHGATRRAHYDALASQMRSPLPADLHAFFHVNTDVGAWAWGRRVAERLIAADPRRAALVIRCLVPRTLIDCNRVPEAGGGDLREGAVTPGLAPYVSHPDDIALLRDLHRRYVARVADALDEVCGAGGLALLPHTYAPRSVGIAQIDAQIVENLRAAWAPGVAETWPLRAPVDLITRTEDGTCSAPEGAEAALVAALEAAGYATEVGGTYFLHPSTLAAAWAARHPGRVVCAEVRRDLLVTAWDPFVEMAVDPAKVDRVAAAFADALEPFLRA